MINVRVRPTAVKVLTIALAAALPLVSCHDTRPRSGRSFDEIHHLVAGKTAGEVERLLGEPDTRQRVYGSDEKWIWWNYTFLDGNDYPPEVRGHVVHLEIVFRSPAGRREQKAPASDWPIDTTFGVNFKMPAAGG